MLSSALIVGTVALALAGGCSKQPGESSTTEPENPQVNQQPDDAKTLHDKAMTARNAGDSTTAFQLLDRACLMKDSDSCIELARAYLHADGTGKDVQKAIALFTDACKSGNASACGDLATIYEEGVDIAAAPEIARLWLLDGCKLKDAATCERAGRSLWKEPDPKAAALGYKLLQLACEYGSDSACSEVNRLDEIMDEAEDGSDSDGSASPVTTNAYGIRWTVSPELVKYLRIKKVECSKLRSTQTCYLTIELPEGEFEDRGQLTEAIAYDGDDVQVAKRPVGGMNFMGVAPGRSIKVRIGTLGLDTKRIEIVLN